MVPIEADPAITFVALGHQHFLLNTEAIEDAYITGVEFFMASGGTLKLIVSTTEII